ncbi:uncharacterized protein [Palaemon carinicauda]|uniref:uncharacterized protein n=1 Tax=Palaemon carinicauda TaxID=392227 RepID=UPI0035B62A8B
MRGLNHQGSRSPQINQVMLAIFRLIDLFATSDNKKLPRYMAPYEDPLAEAVDAMSLDWNGWTCIYLFPPTNLPLKVLNKLRSFQGTAALMAPKWPTSNLVPLVLELNLRLVPLPDPVQTQQCEETVIHKNAY